MKRHVVRCQYWVWLRDQVRKNPGLSEVSQSNPHSPCMTCQECKETIEEADEQEARTWEENRNR